MFVRGVVVRSGAGRLWSGREWMDFGRGKGGKVAGEDVALRPLALSDVSAVRLASTYSFTTFSSGKEIHLEAFLLHALLYAIY